VRTSPVSIYASAAVTKFFRLLGGLVGFGFVLGGTLLLCSPPNSDPVAGSSLLLGGAYFLHYAIRGQRNLYERKHKLGD